MKEWYATFGGGHTHPLTDESLQNCYTVIWAETYGEAHNIMTRSVFGRQWAFLYEFANRVPAGHMGNGKAAGVVEFGLREIPFIPPSPVAEALWEAFASNTKSIVVSAPLWIDMVLRPAEIAHWRSMAEAGHVAQLTPEAASTLSNPSFWLHASSSPVAQHPATADECDAISRSDEVEPANDDAIPLPRVTLEDIETFAAQLAQDHGEQPSAYARAGLWAGYARALDAERQDIHARLSAALLVVDAVGAYTSACVIGTDPDGPALVRAWKTWHEQQTGA